ncbi:zinc finger protein VAR3, chloroplastic-like [Bidens hawaiensis]|uniref:zinc finger protein VAR3, chloroplastic-like n=1 Tax=Bidens hawaiensis TaxID=980011 RepID=UPI00404B256C
MLKRISQTLKSITQISNNIHTRSKTLIPNPAINFILDEIDSLQSSNHVNNNNNNNNINKPIQPADTVCSSIQVKHQWPEWIGLMEKLMKNGYFDGVKNHPFQSGLLDDSKGCNEIRSVQTACLNFARDRPGLMRCFMDGDIEMIARAGCPTIDRKVVNSGKRLRAHLGIDEGNVCSSCNLRGNCERAYMKAHGNEGGHTVDVMRIVLTYALDHNNPISNTKLEEAIRRLTNHMVKFSNNKPDINPSNRSPSVQKSPTQQQEPQSTPTFQERHPRSRDHVQLKGDWLCIRCNFFNFAKNTRCLQCHTNPPKRRLNPGEWECDSCNYINFKRNMVCLKCDHKRAKAFNTSTWLQRSNAVD